MSLLGSAPLGLGLGLGSTLASLFQGCSSAVWQREESEIIQVRAKTGPCLFGICTFQTTIDIPHPSTAGLPLPRGGKAPAARFAAAGGSARRRPPAGDARAALQPPPSEPEPSQEPALLNPGNKRPLYSHLIQRARVSPSPHPPRRQQVEGGGSSSSSGRTIHGAAVDFGGTHPQGLGPIQYLHLYVSRPQGKFWLLDLGTPNAPIKTLTPTLLPRQSGAPPSLGGRLFLLPALRQGGERGRCMLSWTPLGALYVLVMGRGGEGEEEEGEGEEEEKDEEDGPRAVCLWSRGLHSLAVRLFVRLAEHAFFPCVGLDLRLDTHMNAAPGRRRSQRRRTTIAPRPPARPGQGRGDAGTRPCPDTRHASRG